MAEISMSTPLATPPNIILIVTDDQGYGDLCCHGNTMIHTPQLDRLHGESVRLTNFHVDPTCAPTRAALLTGRYSTRSGVWHTIMGRSLLHRDERTMADVLGDAGYRTGIFGKWHLGDNYPMRPQDRGFGESVVFSGGGIGQTPDHWGNDYYDDTYLHNGVPERYTGYCTDVFFAEAVKFIAADTSRPFFAYIATNVPHSPYIVPERYRLPYAERGVPRPMDSFYGMIENMDENLGRLRAGLQALGVDNNTLLIFATDNGTAAGIVNGAIPSGTGAPESNPSGWHGFNAGMRGIKASEYDGGHRVPCFWRWPAGGIGGGREVVPLTAHFDVLPTLIDLCAITPPTGAEFDGCSLAPLLRGTAVKWPERTLFVHRQRAEIPPKWTASAVMTDRWRYNNGGELYEIQRDPGQMTNVAAQHPAVVAELRSRYETWWNSLAPAMARYAFIVVGSEKADPVRLSCHDWHAEDQKDIPWNQTQIQVAPWANGYWMIEVARTGRFEVTLRQQPAEAEFPIQAARARVAVDDYEATAVVPAGVTSVTLPLSLRGGPARLQTWLMDDAAGKSRGAFFVELRWLE